MKPPTKTRLLLTLILMGCLGLASADDRVPRGSAITNYQLGLDNGLERRESYPLNGIAPMTPMWLQSMEIGMQESSEISVNDTDSFGNHPWESYPYAASEQQDHLVYGSIQVPFGHHWHSEPTLYFSSNSANGDNEWRAVSRFNYRQHQVWSLGLHVGYGQVLSESAASEGSVMAFGTIWRTRVGGNHNLIFSMTHESRPGDDTTLAMLAVELKLPKMWR